MKDKDNPIYPFEAAVARIEATAAAADAFGFAFHLTGRCELLAGECGSGRYNPPIESLRRCGRKGSYRTRTSRPRGGEDHLQRAFHTVQFHGGYSGPVLRCRVTASVRRPASGLSVWRRRSIEAPCKRLSMRRRKPATKAHSDLSKRFCPRWTRPDP